MYVTSEKLKDFSSAVFGIVLVIAFLSILVLFIFGSIWAIKYLFQPLIVIGWLAIAIDILVLLPLSLFRRVRGFTGTAIFISSFIFGLVAWLLSFIFTYSLWGFWAVLVGIVFFGGTVVPFALLATMFNGMWEPFFTVFILLIITFGSRVAGIFIADKQ